MGVCTDWEQKWWYLQGVDQFEVSRRGRVDDCRFFSTIKAELQRAGNKEDVLDKLNVLEQRCGCGKGVVPVPAGFQRRMNTVPAEKQCQKDTNMASTCEITVA